MISTVKTDDLEMEYFTFGHGDKIMVLLPGMSVDSVLKYADMVKEAYQIFEDDFTVYLIDRRKDMPDKYTVYDMAKDTAEAMSMLDLSDVYLFGVSQGGMMAMDIAIEHPELVHKLAVGSTSPYMNKEQLEVIDNWREVAETGDAEALYMAFGEKIYSKEVFESSKELLKEAAKTVTDEDLRRFIIGAEGMKGFDILDDLNGITCPMFAIGARDDGVLGAEATADIAEKMKDHSGFDRYMYDGYGHTAFDFAPDYKERVLKFFVKD